MKTKNLVICIGDSTTGGSDKAQVAWPRRLEKYLGVRWSCPNLALGGRTAVQIKSIWNDCVHVPLPYANAGRKWLVVMGGVNDIAATSPDDNTTAISVAASAYTNLKTIFDQMVTAGGWAGGLFCTPLPFGQYAGWSAPRQVGYVSDANSLRNKILGYSNTGVQIVDLYTALGDNVTPANLSTAAAGSFTVNGQTFNKLDFKTTSAVGTTDGLHENDNGHDMIAKVLATYIS